MEQLDQKKRRLRFSMLNLLMLMTMVALAFGLLSAMQNNQRIQSRNKRLKFEMQEIREENARLRAEQGELTIHDEDKVYAIRLPNLPENVWTYRVYLPPGDTYFATACVNDLPTGNYLPIKIDEKPPNTKTTGAVLVGKSDGVTKGLEPGKYLITMMVYQNEGKWSYRFQIKEATENSTRSSTVGAMIRANENEWPQSNKFRMLSMGGVTEKQEESKLQEGLLLLDYRRSEPVPGALSSDSPYGALLWIDRVSNCEKE